MKEKKREQRQFETKKTERERKKERTNDKFINGSKLNRK